MIDFIKDKIAGKRLLLLGFGREGKSTYLLLRKYFPELKIAFADKSEEIVKQVRDGNTTFHVGESYLDAISEYDLVFKSPGISLNHLVVSIPREKITSQTDIFLNCYSEQIIGITGTKGKSTTSSLIFHIIKQHDEDAVLIGNIGIPPFDLIEQIKDSTKIVCELSSHQLEYISKGPAIAILLNLFQEHLDHYKSYLDYQQSKLNIIRYQDKDGNVIFNADDELIKQRFDEIKMQRNYFGNSLLVSQIQGCWADQDKIYFSEGNRTSIVIDQIEQFPIKGQHNVRNIMAAICACKIMGIPDHKIKEGIQSFQGLEHRMEYVGEFDGILFYNDSIATIPEATIEAIKSLKDVETLILGGFDRGIDYKHLINFLAESSITNLLFLGEAGKRMALEMKDVKFTCKNSLLVNNIEEAVRKAKELTNAKGICLLSPAAASYDMFKNFEDRGMVYKKLVRDL